MLKKQHNLFRFLIFSLFGLQNRSYFDPHCKHGKPKQLFGTSAHRDFEGTASRFHQEENTSEKHNFSQKFYLFPGTYFGMEMSS